MKSWLSSTLTALILVLAFTANAQDDCECPPADEAEYCALNFLTGDIDTVVGTECELACDGWLILAEGSCDDGSDPTDPWDCECDYDDYAPVCVTLDDGSLCTFFNACEAECFGYSDWEDGECEYTAECDCPEDEPELEYCVLNLWTGEQETIVGSECELFCEGFLILNEGSCEDIPGECDCDYSVYEPVCVTTDEGELYTFFNACEAECFGYTDYSEGECEYPDPCDDCPEDEPVLEYCGLNFNTGEYGSVTGQECQLFCEGWIILNEGPCEEEGCGCPDEEIGTYCVVSWWSDEVVTMDGTPCELECEGYFIVGDGDCEDLPDPCDCPEDEVGTYCVGSWYSDEIFTMIGTICEIECEGYFILGDGECDDVPDPCDCPDEEIGVYCVMDWWGEIWITEGTVCELECEGLLIIGDGDCEDLGDPCDCPEDEWGVFCVTSWWSDEVFTIEGNPCELECEGFIIVGDGDCGDDPWDGCGCPEDEPVEVYCALNTWSGDIETVEGSECQLFCDGYFILADGACDEVDPEGCDCPEDEALEEFCVTDWATGICYTVESTACLLECEGIFFYSEGACDDIGDPIDPCDCPDDEEVADYCVINLWTGELEVVTGSECELFCEGFIIIGDGDCEGPGEGDPDEGCDCPEEDLIDFCVLDFTTGETIAMTSTACQLVCDGYFIFWEGSCDDIDGADDGDGNTLIALEDWSEEVDIDDMMMFPVPAEDMVNVSLKSSGEGTVNVEVYSVTGRLIQAEQWTLNGGTEIRQLNINDLAPGMYTVSLTNKNGKRTSGQIIKK